MMKAKKYTCLSFLFAVLLMFSVAADCEEEKGFFAKMRDRFRDKEDTAMVTTPGSESEASPVPPVSPSTGAKEPSAVKTGQVTLPETSSSGAVPRPYGTEPDVKDAAESSASGEKKVTVRSPILEDEIDEISFEEEDDAADDDGTSPEERPKPSKKHMEEIIKRRLRIYSQLVFMIPGLEIKKNESGEDEYYYSEDGEISLRLKDLDEATMKDLYNRVNNEASRLDAERLHLQMLQQQQLMRTLQQQVQQQAQQQAQQHQAQQQAQQQQQQQAQQQQTQQQSRPVQPPPVFTPPPEPPRVHIPPQPPPQPSRRQ